MFEKSLFLLIASPNVRIYIHSCVEFRYLSISEEENPTCVL